MSGNLQWCFVKVSKPSAADRTRKQNGDNDNYTFVLYCGPQTPKEMFPQVELKVSVEKMSVLEQ